MMFEGCFYLVLQGGVVHGVLFIFEKFCLFGLNCTL